MNTIIRAHIKNEERLSGLRRELESWHRKGLSVLGDLYIVDDGSPMRREVEELADLYDANYRRASGNPDTKNGLAESLRVQLESGKPCLHCVDDAVFGDGILQRLIDLTHIEEPKLGDYSTIGLFACYEEGTRNANKLPNVDLWKIDHKILYALVSHIFSMKMARHLVTNWNLVLLGSIPYPKMCDDIWVAIESAKVGLPCYNTMKDYAQHTGVNNRTFGDNAGSEYVSKMFVGENNPLGLPRPSKSATI